MIKYLILNNRRVCAREHFTVLWKMYRTILFERKLCERSAARVCVRASVYVQTANDSTRVRAILCINITRQASRLFHIL